MALIDAALDALRVGFVGDRGALGTPHSAAGGGSGGGSGSASVRSALTSATVSCGVRRQDIVVATVRAREQVGPGALADRAAIDALVRQLKSEIPLEALPPPPATARARL